MRQQARLGISVGNPIANLLVMIAGILAIGVSIVLGFVAIVVIGTLLIVAATVIPIRVWWFDRRLRRQTAQSGAQQSSGEFIEGEYRVIDVGSKRQ